MTPVVYTLKPNDPGHPLRDIVASMDESPQLPQLRDLEAALLASPYWAKLKKHLLNLEAKVDNIVCVALGDIVTHKGLLGPPTDELSLRSASQHLLATLISRFLSKHYAEAKSPTSSNEPKVPIPIVAFDPKYGIQSHNILSRLDPPIDVVSDPCHMLSVTPNTLFMCVHLPNDIPFWEIIAGICFPSGPAAMLCNEIHKFSWHEEGLIQHIDSWTPRVGCMLDKFDKTWLGAACNGVHRVVDGEDSSKWMVVMYLYARKK